MFRRIRAAIKAFQRPDTYIDMDAAISVMIVMKALKDVYPDEMDRYHWLFRRHSAFGNDAPIDRIRAGKLEDVQVIIDQLLSGAFV